MTLGLVFVTSRGPICDECVNKMHHDGGGGGGGGGVSLCPSVTPH